MLELVERFVLSLRIPCVSRCWPLHWRLGEMGPSGGQHSIEQLILLGWQWHVHCYGHVGFGHLILRRGFCECIKARLIFIHVFLEMAVRGCVRKSVQHVAFCFATFSNDFSCIFPGFFWTVLPDRYSGLLQGMRSNVWERRWSLQ